MKTLILVILFSVMPLSVMADVYGEFGIAVGHPEGAFVSDSKNVEFGYTNALKWGRFQAGLGGWTDTSAFVGARESLYVQGSLGLEPDLKWFYANYHLGPALLSNTDTLLGSRWQIFQSFGVGVKDYRGIRIGVLWKHLSNGGLAKPNKGRNYVNLRVQF